jgi:hypothetical protein
VTYNDSTNDLGVGSFPHIDITSVEVSNTMTTLTFKINLNGDPVATDWGKYMVGIDKSAGGDTASNGWVRPISMQGGMEHWIGSWVNFGNGAQLWDYTGSWSQDSATGGVNPANIGISKDTSSVTITLDFASLGLGMGNSFSFDVYTSGGGGTDGAVDALSAASPSITNWGDSFQTSTGNAKNYTLVPEPAAALLGSIAALALLRRRR